MTKHVTVNYCGMEGSGRSVTEAKKDAARKLEQAVSGSYEPILLSCRRYAVLVYRKPLGWDYCTVADETGFRTSLCAGSYDDNKQFIMDAARWHLAQLAWLPADGLEAPDMVLMDMPRHQREFRSWAEFQLRYRDAIRLGMSANDAHDYAGRNPARPEIWTTAVVNS